jgi:hypothetical protein
MNPLSIFADHPEPKPVSGPFQHADAVAAGLRFHCLHQGAGFPVILLSGFP